MNATSRDTSNPITPAQFVRVTCLLYGIGFAVTLPLGLALAIWSTM